MKKTLITIVLTIVVVLTLIAVALASVSGFSGGIPQRSFGNGYDDFAFPEEPAAPPIAADAYAPGIGGGADLAYEESAVAFNAAAQTDRLVIQNVDMSIVVPDPKTRMEEIGDLAVEMGGYVVSSNLYQSQYGPNNIEVPGANMTVRIPSERLDEALEKIKAGAVKIEYENRSGEDVTNQYVDLESRLKVLRSTEEKFLEILEEAENTEDTLAVLAQLRQIQTEIEMIVGQMQYYEESVALSAVSIQLIAEETIKPIEIGGWKLQGTANEAVQDLIRFVQGFIQFLIRFVIFNLPALILIAIPLYLVFLGGRALLRRFGRSQTEADIIEDEEK